MTTTPVRLAVNQSVAAADQRSEERDALIYRSLRHFWHPVCYVDDLSCDKPQREYLLGEALVVVRLVDEIRVFNDLCAHRGAALSLGTVVDGCELRCPYHGWQYDGDGTCVHIPQRPDLVEHLRVGIRRYQAVERFGLVWVCLEDQAHYPLPMFPHWEDSTFDKIFIRADDWDCSAERRTENYTDLSHFAILHDGLLGDVLHPEVPAHRVWPESTFLRMELLEGQHEPRNTAKNAALASATDDELIQVSKNWHIFMPLTVLLDTQQGSGERLALFFHPTPLGPNKIRNFTIGARNYGRACDIHVELAQFVLSVYDQDRPVVESQRPSGVPLNLAQEMYLKDAEALAVVYRRWIINLARELADSRG